MITSSPTMTNSNGRAPRRDWMSSSTSDTVIAETMPGYLLHNRVLRAALVSVAGAPDEDN